MSPNGMAQTRSIATTPYPNATQGLNRGQIRGASSGARNSTTRAIAAKPGRNSPTSSGADSLANVHIDSLSHHPVGMAHVSAR
ncbi:MAG TPA: hypothetical protein VLB03_00430 [Nocardioidaceae bacterium]|nr:hypothetical protein [Nocardioidaceae bacterium]